MTQDMHHDAFFIVLNGRVVSGSAVAFSNVLAIGDFLFENFLFKN